MNVLYTLCHKADESPNQQFDSLIRWMLYFLLPIRNITDFPGTAVLIQLSNKWFPLDAPINEMTLAQGCQTQS